MAHGPSAGKAPVWQSAARIANRWHAAYWRLGINPR